MRLFIFTAAVWMLCVDGQQRQALTGVTNSIEKGLELVNVKRAASDGATLPDWLKNDDTSDEKKNDKTHSAILNELTNDGENKITLTTEEIQTVDRFIKALKDISDGEEKLKKRESLTIKDSVDVCSDRRDDCSIYEDYCSSHKRTMEVECAKTCQFCHACDDIATPSHCEQIKQINLCNREEAKRYCAKTCDVCENQCGNSVYGCCSDKKTEKEDEEGSNCPVCKDKFANVCMMFKNDCENYSGAGKWLQKNCPVTCGICEETVSEEMEIDNNCRDNEMQKEFCPLWKNAGWCSIKSDLMGAYCAKTCQMCNYK